MSDKTKAYDEALIAKHIDDLVANTGIHSYAQLTLRVVAKIEQDGSSLSEEEKEDISEIIHKLAPLGATDLDNRLYHAASERPWYTALVLFIVLGTAGAVLEYFVQSGLDDLMATKPKVPLEVQVKEKSVTVLPFANITASPKVDWLSLGLAEAIEGKLAAVPNLQIIARPRASSEAESFQKAKSLGVLVGVAGSFQVVGEQIQINAKLIDLQKDNVILASHKEQGKIKKLFDLQDKLALKIAKKLGFTFTKSQEKALTKKGTRNMEAFRLFVIGKKLLEEGRTIEAIEQLAKAATYDPTYQAATKELSFIKAAAQHIRINNDGSTTYHSMIDFPQWPGGDHYRVNSGVGRTIAARDSKGRPILLDCKEIKQGVWRSIFTFPHPPKKGERVRIICDIEGQQSVFQNGELFFTHNQYGTSVSAQKLFIIEPPNEADIVFLVPLPEAVIEQDGRTYFLFHQYQEEFVYTEWTLCYTFAAKAKDEFLQWHKKRQVEALTTKIFTPPYRLIEQIKPFVMAEAIRLEDFKKAKALIEEIEASKSNFGPFFAHWGRGTMAWARGKRGLALGFLEAAAETKRKPAHLMDDLFRKIIEINEERGMAKKVLRLLDKELKERSWWSHRSFHDLPQKDDLSLLRKLVQEKKGGLTAIYDLALQYRRLDKLEEAWRTIKPLLYRQLNPYVIRLAASIAVARNDTKQAFALMKKLADKLPLERAHYYHIAMLIEAGRVKTAIRLFKKEAEKANFRHWYFDDLASRVLVLVKEPKAYLAEAEKVLKLFIKANKKDASSLYLISQLSSLLQVKGKNQEVFALWLMAMVKKHHKEKSPLRERFKKQIERFVARLLRFEFVAGEEKILLTAIYEKLTKEKQSEAQDALTTGAQLGK